MSEFCLMVDAPYVVYTTTNEVHTNYGLHISNVDDLAVVGFATNRATLLSYLT